MDRRLVSNGTSPTLPWVIAIVATAIGAGALGYFAGNYTAPSSVPAAAAPQNPAAAAQNGQLPPGTTSEKIGDWVLFCQDAPDGKKGCSATQDIANPQGQIVLSVIAGYDEQAQKAFLVRAPLGINLGAGLEFNLPGDKPVAFEFLACDQMSCNAILTVLDKNWPKMEAAKSFELAYTRGDGVRVPATISLAGLADSFTKIEKPVPVAAPAAPVEGAAPAPETPAPAPAPTEPAPAAPAGTPEPTPKPAQP